MQNITLQKYLEIYTKTQENEIWQQNFFKALFDVTELHDCARRNSPTISPDDRSLCSAELASVSF